MIDKETLFKLALEHSHVEERWVRKLDPDVCDEILKNTGRNFGEKMYKYITGDKGLCTECGKPCRFYGFTEGYRAHKCSSKCYLASLGVTSQFALPEIQQKVKKRREEGCYENSVRRSKETKERKYGKEYAKQFSKKSVSTKLEKYGTLKVGLEKRKQTCLERYGETGRSEKQKEAARILHVNYGFGSTVYKEWLDKQGVSNVSQLSDIKKQKHIKRTENVFRNLLLHLDTSLKPQFDSNEFEGYGREYTFLCKNCGKTFTYNKHQMSYIRCPHCFPKRDYTSYAQQEITNYIESLGLSFQTNVRGFLSKNRELDIYIPECKLAIEYDGLHWHGEAGGNKDAQYHLNKTKECNLKGIRLIHIFEDEWLYKQDIVKARLRYALGKETKHYSARKCTIRLISAETSSQFLEQNHIQGSDRSSIRLGAFSNGELVAVMTFGKLRVALGQKSKEGSFELMRFCTNMSCIPGICQKLFKYFIECYSPKRVISYADRRWSYESGNTMYEKMGFIKESDGTPNYWYFKCNELKRYHRFGFRKNLLPNLLGTNYDSSLSEWENMKASGYDRIWDCGSYRFVYCV